LRHKLEDGLPAKAPLYIYLFIYYFFNSSLTLDTSVERNYWYFFPLDVLPESFYTLRDMPVERFAWIMYAQLYVIRQQSFFSFFFIQRSTCSPFYEVLFILSFINRKYHAYVVYIIYTYFIDMWDLFKIYTTHTNQHVLRTTRYCF